MTCTMKYRAINNKWDVPVLCVWTVVFFFIFHDVIAFPELHDLGGAQFNC